MNFAFLGSLADIPRIPSPTLARNNTALTLCVTVAFFTKYSVLPALVARYITNSFLPPLLFFPSLVRTFKTELSHTYVYTRESRIRALSAGAITRAFVSFFLAIKYACCLCNSWCVCFLFRVSKCFKFHACAIYRLAFAAWNTVGA